MTTVSREVRQNVQFLQTILRSRSVKQRRRLIESATRDQLHAILEVCINLLRFRVPVTPQQKKSLLAHADAIRRLSRQRSVESVRRILLSSSASMLSALLRPLLRHSS